MTPVAAAAQPPIICAEDAMTHAGLPFEWAAVVGVFMLGLAVWSLWKPLPEKLSSRRFNLTKVPGLGPLVKTLNAQPHAQFILRLIMVGLFIMVITAGLFGTPVPERNAATVLTWNLWWAGLIISVFFVGTAWCGVCPWDTLASWLVRRRLWGRGEFNNSLNLRVPDALRNVYPALFLLIGLTWLELGVGITLSPYATATISLMMVVMATVSLALFERKAFCRYFCPVGRTIGAYAQLASVELRAIDTDICARCTTLECYHGSESVEPCPTNLVMGRLKQNTYCTSCGNCTQSCPTSNIAWHLRPASAEAAEQARPHMDAAWFMLGLLGLTGFHGLTMLVPWQTQISALGQWLGDSGQLLWAFSLGLSLNLLIIIAFFALMVWLTVRQDIFKVSFKQAFTRLAPVSLPLAFAYHLAHNLKHLIRESSDIGALLQNPLGRDTLPLNELERHLQYLNSYAPDQVLSLIQTALILWGVWMAFKILRHRGRAILNEATALNFLPMMFFIFSITSYHVWLLTQDMIMRM